MTAVVWLMAPMLDRSKVDDPDKNGWPDVPGWGVGRETNNLTP